MGYDEAAILLYAVCKHTADGERKWAGKNQTQKSKVYTIYSANHINIWRTKKR